MPVLERQPNAVGFGGEPAVRGIAVESGQLPGLRDLDGVIELLRFEELLPELLCVRADSLDFDPAPSDLGREDFNGLRPVWPFEDRTFGQMAQNIVGVYDAPRSCFPDNNDEFAGPLASPTAMLTDYCNQNTIFDGAKQAGEQAESNAIRRNHP